MSTGARRGKKEESAADRRKHWLESARQAAVEMALPDFEPNGPKRRSIIGRTIHGRLAIVFAVLLLPPTILSIWLAWESFGEQKVRARLQVRQFAMMTATYENKFFDDVQANLRRLATEPPLRQADVAGCFEVLSAALPRTPQFAALTLYDEQGAPICSTSDLLQTVGDRDWHREALMVDGIAISDYTVTPDSEYPAIVAAQPVKDDTGARMGVLAATIRIYWLSEFVKEIELPASSIYFLIDGNGNVLAGRIVSGERAPPSAPSIVGGFVSQPEPALGRDDLIKVAGPQFRDEIGARPMAVFEVEGEDGVRRVFSAVALPHGGVTALFGIPATNMLGWLEEDMTNQMLAIVAMWASGIVAAWLGARHLVTRWIATLRGMAHDYGRGDYSARRNLRRAPEELGDLGATLALMARRVQDREADLKATVAQKDILLKEIHHRVKNNLQIVSSLLNIRGDRVTGAEGLAAIDEVKTQVRALALVHRHLYESEDVLEIDLRSFMTELCQSSLAALAQPAGPVELELDIPEFMIATDTAIPIALLTVEAMTNALKHAFPNGRPGKITVRFEPDKEGAGVLTITDDGVGMAKDALNGGGIGLTLIDAFARQVEGKVEITGPPGTTIAVTLSAEGETAEAIPLGSARRGDPPAAA